MSSRQAWLIRVFFFLGLAGLVLLSIFLLKRTIPFEIQSLLAADHPVRIQYERDQKGFNDEASAWLVVQRTQPFSSSELEAFSEKIGRFMEMNVGLESVAGPHNAQYFQIDDRGVKLTPFLKNGQWTEDAAEKLKIDLWKNNLVREDQTAFLMSFRFMRDLKRKDEKPLVDRIETFLHQLEQENPGLSTGLLGAKVASAAFLGEMQFQQRVITPLLLLAIGIFLFFCYRSWQILLWNYFVMFVCYAATLCLIILVEGGLGPYSSFALMFAFIVATTDLIHFFSRFQQLDGSHEERLRKTLKIAAVPCLLTSLTTAAGFIALVVNQNLPIRYFGLYCAFSCLLEWVVIFWVLPWILRAFRFNPGEYRVDVRKFSASMGPVLDRYGKLIVAASFGLLIVGAVGTFGLHIDDNFYTKFVNDHRLSRSIDLFSKQFQFVGSIDLVIQSQDDLFASDQLRTLAEFEKEIQSHPLVSRISSLRQIDDDVRRELPRNLQPDRADELRRAILNLFNDYGVIRDFTNESTKEIRTVVFLKSLSTPDFNQVLTFIEGLKDKYKGRLEFRPSGFSVIRSFINGRVIQDFFESFFLSFLLIFLCYFWLYKNFKWALLALVPNAVPLLAVSGLMGLFRVPVDTNLVILICVSFGVSGDNSVHLTYVLQQEMKRGLSYDAALSQALKLIGIAMVATSGVFLFCLPVFLLGSLKLFGHVAIFLSVSFLMAFLADLLMFPAFQKQMGWRFSPDHGDAPS